MCCRAFNRYAIASSSQLTHIDTYEPRTLTCWFTTCHRREKFDYNIYERETINGTSSNCSTSLSSKERKDRDTTKRDKKTKRASEGGKGAGSDTAFKMEISRSEVAVWKYSEHCFYATVCQTSANSNKTTISTSSTLINYT